MRTLPARQAAWIAAGLLLAGAGCVALARAELARARDAFETGGPRHQATLKALIEAGAYLQLKDRQGQTPLRLAKSRGYTEMVKMLEAAGAK